MRLIKLAFAENYLGRTLEREGFQCDVSWLICHKEKWHNLRYEEIVDEKILKVLGSLVKSGAKSWRAKNSQIAYFLHAPSESVIETSFLQKPSKKTRQRIEDAVIESIEWGTNKYNAIHDNLTGLLNRNGFDEELAQLLKQTVAAQPTSKPENDIAPDGVSSQIWFMSLDVDRFKQINDSFGHLYGDLVLRLVGKRLESEVSQICVQLGLSHSIVARMGGEEFGVVLQGSLPKARMEEICQRLLQKFSDGILPSIEEWKNDAPTEVILPHISERKVTVSIGYALSTGDNSDVQKFKSLVCNQADIALARAKATGRNRSVFYSDILDKYGRVIESHPETGFIAIDVGRQVGAAVGHEFKVFHPAFAGGNDFLHEDGRSVRVLGRYPRLETARIEVIDVQIEIAFCKIAENHGLKLPVVGSYLELIPAGSIAHLLTGAFPGAKSSGNILSNADIQKEIDALANSGVEVKVASFTLNDSLAILSKKGAAYLNKALALLIQTVQTELPDIPKVAQLETDTFIVLLNAQSVFDDGVAAKIASTVQRAFQDEFKLSVGFYPGAGKIGKNKSPGDQSKINNKYALDYALYAGKLATVEGKRFVEFTSSVFNSLIFHYRKSGEYDRAIQDYARLGQLGINHALVHNQFFLIAQGNSDYERALLASRIAHEMLPKDKILHMNLAIAEFATGSKEVAFNIFSVFGAYSGDKELHVSFLESQPIYIAWATKVGMEYRKSNPVAVGAVTLLSLARNALERDKDWKGGSLDFLTGTIEALESEIFDSTEKDEKI